MLHMIINTLTMYTDVIKIYNNKAMDEGFENLVHDPYKGTWGITKFKRHY